MSVWVDEGAFIAALRSRLTRFHKRYAAVTGPGRSGAVAAAYASYLTGRPFVPYGQPHPGPILIVDTASMSGRTIRKARSRYKKMGIQAYTLPIYASPHTRYKFWYERPVDNPVDGSPFDYNWSLDSLRFWYKTLPWHGPPPRPTTGCGCLWWFLVIWFMFIVCSALF